MSRLGFCTAGWVLALCMLPVSKLRADEMNNIERAGDLLQLILPLSAYTSTLISGEDKARSEFVQSWMLNTAVTYGLKVIINKRRPNGGPHSFPSGHTSAAFVGASFIAGRYGMRYGIPAYLAASFVGYSRLKGISDKHFLVDVMAGAALGCISNYLVSNRDVKLKILPVIRNGTYGMGFQVSW